MVIGERCACCLPLTWKMYVGRFPSLPDSSVACAEGVIFGLGLGALAGVAVGDFWGFYLFVFF